MHGNQENSTRGQLKVVKETKVALTIPSMVTVRSFMWSAPFRVRLGHGRRKSNENNKIQTNKLPAVWLTKSTDNNSLPCCAGTVLVTANYHELTQDAPHYDQHQSAISM